jgi:hypothetical protein
MTETTATGWAWQAFAPAAMLDDEAMYKAWLQHAVDDARRAATEQGYQVDGEPEITKEAGAVVETKDGPMMVGLDFARLSGYDGPPTWYRHRFQFDSAQKVN